MHLQNCWTDLVQICEDLLWRPHLTFWWRLPHESRQQGASWSWKVMEFRKTIFQAWKVMENSKGHGKPLGHGKWSCYVIFTEAAGAQEQRMNLYWTVVIFVNRQVVLSFWRWYYEQLELWLLILVCIHKSYIVYFEISFVSFYWSWKNEKSWKINVGKEGHPGLCFCGVYKYA